MPIPSDAKVVIVGLARNCADTIEQNLAALRRAASPFPNAQALVIESDSGDGTVASLARLSAADPSLRYVSMGALAPRHPKRTDRIAQCRNRYITELRDHPAYDKTSHVIVADLDGVSRDITAEAIASCWAPGAPPWDVCTANQGDYYYDIWALRHDSWCPGDAWKEHDRLQEILGPVAAKEIAIYSRMVHIPPFRPMIEVRSAFGGFAIYRREALIAGSYRGLDEEGNEICEHVGLHLDLIQKGLRIFINPKMINARTTSNASIKKFYPRFRRKLGSWLRRRA